MGRQGVTTAIMRLIERVERLEATGEIGDGTVAQLHELASLARYEQVGRSAIVEHGSGQPLRPAARPCGACAYGDQMLCACGLAWVIDDPDPPGCPWGGR